MNKGILAGTAFTTLMVLLLHIWFWPKLEIAKPPPPLYEQVELKNACYINATGFKEAYEAKMALEKRAHWAHLVYVDVLTIQGHAMCMFEQNNRFKLYDSARGTLDIGPFDKEHLPKIEEVVKQMSPFYFNGKWFE